jgi:hypothetical protein
VPLRTPGRDSRQAGVRVQVMLSPRMIAADGGRPASSTARHRLKRTHHRRDTGATPARRPRHPIRRLCRLFRHVAFPTYRVVVVVLGCPRSFTRALETSESCKCAHVPTLATIFQEHQKRLLKHLPVVSALHPPHLQRRPRRESRKTGLPFPTRPESPVSLTLPHRKGNRSNIYMNI